MRTWSSSVDGLLGDILRRSLDVLQQHILDLAADLADRIEGCARILEDHGHLAAAEFPHVVFAGLPQIHVAKRHRALRDMPGAVKDAHHGIGRH